ncbi:hypothetical protein HPB49_014619 [Dermacentor silvarum]|uniref:Uncharacterized protein n=1 Tax=Dermacentor silvarum TaxID=543639 RepID=A0ACB8CXG0_DERSI|nr:hypothetical protein HPB49_014619 [Dermacentor silvarum]
MSGKPVVDETGAGSLLLLFAKMVRAGLTGPSRSMSSKRKSPPTKLSTDELRSEEEQEEDGALCEGADADEEEEEDDEEEDDDETAGRLRLTAASAACSDGDALLSGRAFMGGPPDQLMEEDEDDDVVAAAAAAVAAAEEDEDDDERAAALDEFDEDGRSDSLGSDVLAHSPNGNASYHGGYAPGDRLLGSRHTDSEDSDAYGPGSPAENLTTTSVLSVAHQPHKRRQPPPHQQHHAHQRTPPPPPPLLPPASSEGGRPKKSMDDVLKRLTSKMHTSATLNDGASSRAPLEHRSRGASSGGHADGSDHGGRRRVTLQLEGETLRLALSGGSLRDNERRLTEMINQLQQLRDQLLVQQRLQMVSA